MKKYLIASAAIALIAVPAQAQLLGGSAGGILGGSGSMTSGPLPSLPSLPNTNDVPIRGAVDGTADGSGSVKADRRSGRVDANGSGKGSANSSITGPLVGGSGSGSASGNGSASAQLIGTDALGPTTQSVRSTGQGVVRQTRGTAAGVIGSARSTAGSAGSLAGNSAVNGQGAANGMASGALSPLAVAGSAAAAGNGAFEVNKGMPVLAPNGEKIGKVRQVIADSRGRVQALLVKVDGEKALLPAANFSGSGNAVVSAAGEATIKQIADQQDETGENDI